VLTHLVTIAYRQNFSLREAGFRALQARAEIGIHRDGPFRQPPDAGKIDVGEGTTANDQTDAAFEDFDQALVALLADVAADYVRIRTIQTHVTYLQETIELERSVLSFIRRRIAAGYRFSQVDLRLAEADIARTDAQVALLMADLRQASNRLCVLLGRPPEDLAGTLDILRINDLKTVEENKLSPGARAANSMRAPEEGDDKTAGNSRAGNHLPGIPLHPPEITVGVPSDLLRRRQDVRRAARLVAAQAKTLVSTDRTGNDFQLQNARFQQLLAAYQGTVLVALEESENGISNFLAAQVRVKELEKSVAAAEEVVKILASQYQMGMCDINRFLTSENMLRQQQDLLSQALGDVALSAIQTYRSLGVGWETHPPEVLAKIKQPPIGAEIPARVPTPLPLPAPLPDIPEDVSLPPKAPETSKLSPMSGASPAIPKGDRLMPAGTKTTK
jgi:outer membrane protein TolC